MRNKKALWAAVLAGMALAMGGCAGPEPAKSDEATIKSDGAAIKYVEGVAEVIKPRELEAVYSAAELAAAGLELRIMESSKDANSAVIKARDTENERITINLEAAGDKATKVSIDVHGGEKEKKSEIICRQIDENLRKK